MNRRMLPAIFCAVAALCSISAAHAAVLVYEGFHSEDYNNVSSSGNVQANTTFTANHTVGISSSKWNGMNGTQIRVFGENFGLALPQTMIDAGFTAIGGSIGCNPNSNSSDMRAMNHALASKVLNVTSGTLYVRVLVNLDLAAAGKLTARSELVGNAGNYYACGFCMAPSGNDYHLLTHTRSAIAFLLWKNADNKYVLSLGHTTAAEETATFYPLVTGITLGETYLCYAEIRVEAGTGGNEIVRAGAVATSDFTGAAPWAPLGGSSDSVEVQLISASAYPTVMAVAGPYGTKDGYFRADELVVGTELGDILPVGGVFSVSGTGSPTVTTNAFSTDWILVADDGVTADAGFVWSTDETFATATTNSLGTGLSADTRTATLSGLEPDTTYWWKIVAEGNGAEEAESAVASFKTKGAPVLGTATAALNGEVASFSVALATAAMENTLATSVSVFYGTDGETWTELPLGSASEAETFSGSVNNLGHGVTYQWFARASATMEGGRVLSTDSVTNSFTTLYNGDMYVDVAAENATPPYSTPATAAKTIAAALALAADGATIHVAPGLYPISKPIAVTNAIAVLGDDLDPSRVIVSNTVSSSNASQEHRVFIIANAGALVANLTMQKGEAYDRDGGNFNIGTAGGIVSNCVVEAGYARDNGKAAGAWLDAGVVTHSVFRKNYSNSASVNWEGNRAGLLQLNGQARAENCLFTENNQTKAVTLINLGGSSVMRNCTIVNSGLSVTNQYCSSWSALNIASGATVQNVVIVGVTNKIDGAACPPTGSVAKFQNGAFDGDVTGLPEGTVTGTAESFFKDCANGDYTPKTGGPLVGKGANYEGMASVDLAGNKRLVGSKVDIGCYEGDGPGMIILVR